MEIQCTYPGQNIGICYNPKAGFREINKMKNMTRNFIKDLKQTIESEETLLIGKAGSLSYFRFTKSLKPRKAETFELINGVLMRIGRFYIIRDDEVQVDSK